jgi:inorganic pyrophosphatase
VLVVGQYPLMPGCVIAVRPIGVLLMEDESGQDEKILAVPQKKLDPAYNNIKSYKDLPENLIAQIGHFFEHYKDLEANKWVKVTGWQDADDAARMIQEAVERANK